MHDQVHSGNHPNAGDAFGQMLQFGMLSRLSSGNPVLDILVAFLLPMLLRYLSNNVPGWNINSFLPWKMKGYVRCITFTKRSGWWYYRNDDEDEEHAPNCVLHRAILMYINATARDRTLQWKEAEVSTRRKATASSKGADDSDSDDDSSSQGCASIDVFTFLVAPPEDIYVQVWEDVELQRAVEKSKDQGGSGSGSSVQEETTVFRIRSFRRNGAERVDAFLSAAVEHYNRVLLARRDTARYLYIPVLAPSHKTTLVSKGKDEAGAASTDIKFKRYKLGEQRTFTSFFHPDKAAILDLVRAFQDKTGKFGIPGYPQKLGFLLHGPPGTGKTSFIKALAHHTGRHIISIPLSKIRTNQELMDLMYEQRLLLHGADDAASPAQLRFKDVIFVMEDVDCASSVVSRRVPESPPPGPCGPAPAACPAAPPDVTTPAPPAAAVGEAGPGAATAPGAALAPPLPAAPSDNTAVLSSLLAGLVAGPTTAEAGQHMAEGGAAAPVAGASPALPGPAMAAGLLETPMRMKASSSDWMREYLMKASAAEDELNLAGLLNVLDGVVDTPERIIVMTTNHPERLDPALIRPGRINRQVYLGHLRLAEALAMITHYFGAEAPATPLDVELPGEPEELVGSAASSSSSASGQDTMAARLGPQEALDFSPSPSPSPSPCKPGIRSSASSSCAGCQVGVADARPVGASVAGSVGCVAEVLQQVWVDGVVTPAELECMCAEFESVAALAAALCGRFARMGVQPGWLQRDSAA